MQASRGLHSRFVLVFNLRAEKHIHVDHLDMVLGPRQALLIHPHQLHHFSRDKRLPLQWLSCTFEMKSGDFLEPLRNQIIVLQDRSLWAFEELLGIWHDQSSKLKENLLQSKLFELLILLKEDQRNTLASDLLPEPEGSLIRTVNRLLSEQRNATAASLAEALNLSVSYLRARFKAMSGLPLSRYIRHYRINWAMTLLRTTDLPINIVAGEAGFGSPQAFWQTFKREAGHSPKSYRKAR